MSNNYIRTQTSISFSDIVGKNYTLSSSQYMGLVMHNENYLLVEDFLRRPLEEKDLGVEVGSLNYIEESSHYFIRTKALQKHSFLPEITNTTTVPIVPSSFVKMSLKEGDLIISKDGNIGEAVILDRDYPNHMLSGALYNLPTDDKKLYLFAFLKHNFFREQLNFIVPKGANILHAKKLFLKCKIPMPNHNPENIIKFVELLTQAIINKERLIKTKHQDILNRIEKEILSKQTPKINQFKLPTIKEVEEVGRLDTGLYNENFKKIKFLIENYKEGFSTIGDWGFVSSRGQNLQESEIGKSIYSDKYIDGFYKLALPKHFSNYGTLDKEIYFGNSSNLTTLKQGEIVFGAEGTFRSIVICTHSDNFITNIHGITITNERATMQKKCFVACYIAWLKSKKYLEYYSTGGQGGSIGVEKIKDIIVPNFPEKKTRRNCFAIL